ncbi:MAG TPA: biosynthetic peptidoglycan transglycosylase [Spirochaetota bacterium]|nr:biosynthetic peptidoglycan transglycosylase [Spirochaetota bacterium]HPS88233.1 biosynthetic peptidoglycan transglycosylase [Spirochaetota bacterium]
MSKLTVFYIDKTGTSKKTLTMKISSILKDFDFKNFFKKAAGYTLTFHIIFITFIAAAALLYIFVDPPFTTLQAYRFVFNGYSSKKHYDIPIKSISRKYQRLVVSTEDPNFYRHYGIDTGAIATAIQVNMKYGKKLSGASTITQQLTRTLFLFPDKLYIRKYLETIAAITIDAIMPKTRILELYFNYAEWGRGIYGIQSASYYYYGTPLQRISEDQAIRLITLLPSPCKYSPETFEKRKRLNKRYNSLNDRLSAMHSAK